MKRLLIVDDNAEHLELLAILLEGHGYRVDQAANGQEALQSARRNPPDAVISDILMPVMDGFSLCREWKQDAALKCIPFLFHTATYTDSRDKKFARDLGADRFLVKPVEPEELLRVLRDVLSDDELNGGAAASCGSPALAEPVYLKEYSQSLVRKLEDKMLQLEKANRRLSAEIEQRRQVEKNLARLSTAIEQAAESILITDVDGVIQYVNPAFEKISGYQREEALGKRPNILASGRQSKEFYQNLWQTIRFGRVWFGHFINRRKDGSLYEEEASISPVFDAAGAIANFVAVKRDVTNERRMERQIMQSQKMEAIGTLAGGIAHDFNNILTAILGYAMLVHDALPETGPLRQRQAEVIKAGNRARDLVAQILTFSRQRQVERKPIHLQPVIKEALKLLRASLPTTIEIRQRIDSDCGRVLADPTQIHQILMNLCTNAYHAMREQGGVLDVSLRQETIDEEKAGKLLYELPAGTYARLTVRDSGCGMDQRTLERIFEPYFTTKPHGDGTGLGLSVVHGIVAAYGGIITAVSEPGSGAEFTVYLPAVEAAAAELAAPAESGGALPRGSERVLVVDDEEIIGRMIKELLSGLGYQVTVETSAPAALEMIHARPDQFDLLLTDMTMPRMTGLELARKAMELRPGLPVIICSGYSELINEETARGFGIRAYVSKPIDHEDLAALLRRVLDQTRKASGG